MWFSLWWAKYALLWGSLLWLPTSPPTPVALSALWSVMSPFPSSLNWITYRPSMETEFKAIACEPIVDALKQTLLPSWVPLRLFSVDGSISIKTMESLRSTSNVHIRKRPQKIPIAISLHLVTTIKKKSLKRGREEDQISPIVIEETVTLPFNRVSQRLDKSSVDPALKKANAENTITVTTTASVSLLVIKKQGTAPDTTQNKTEKSVEPTWVDGDVPEGFGDLMGESQGSMVLYYAGRELGDINTVVKEGKLTFEDPEKIVELLASLLELTDIIPFLSVPLSTNIELICLENQPLPVCERPKLKNVAVVVNRDWFRVDIFIHHSLIQREQQHLMIESPTVGFSWINHMQLSASGQMKRWQDNVSLLSEQSGIVSYGRTRLEYTLDSRYNRQRLNHRWRDVFLSHYRGRFNYSLGFLSAKGDHFIPDVSFRGLSIETENYLVDRGYLSQFYHQLTVFLEVPSQVTIYRGDQLLVQESLPSGDNRIDTRNFPFGSYEIRIEKKDFLGKAIKFVNGLGKETFYRCFWFRSFVSTLFCPRWLGKSPRFV